VSEPGKKYTAKLREIAPTADSATRTYLAKFSLPEAGDTVSLGMTATLTLCDKATTRVGGCAVGSVQRRRQAVLLCRRRPRDHAEAGQVKAYESNDVVIRRRGRGAKVVALGVQEARPSQKVRVVSSLSF